MDKREAKQLQAHAEKRSQSLAWAVDFLQPIILRGMTLGARIIVTAMMLGTVLWLAYLGHVPPIAKLFGSITGGR